ncbi:chromosome segregation protein SMC [Gemmatirosa kalamazoonensis]|uniref:chromosome segregation protein SMC n=1 Tax=Gemmatirosa kalamazoonensis TaxID=861299 RepID=UPI00130E7317|nr:chromosome segregation protein SMC [Gemmatirosa kalamazoonensis]
MTKLELHGFKSFADHTNLVFDRGATAIVGPNGCGKSNVSDSIRWVLGEQRARMLRGGSMTEVIFQGSSARKPVNVAEVSLHFDNADGTLPVPFKEVVITRRLSRSGDSEYFLNRAPCRLRDIQDLVRGTGLGADSGVVIESKMIDALLSDRPDDRRELFEEAAGVGLYRDRRRSAERRLEETTVDLSRLDDLINEVGQQVRALARQRRRAERHAELTARRFNVELTLAGREMEEWRDELARLDARLAELQQANPQAEARLGEAEREREQAHQRRGSAEASRGELARIAAAQREDVLTLRGEIAVAEERHRNASSRRSRAEEERREGEALGERMQAERERAIDERRQTEEALRVAIEELAQRTALEEETRRVVASARQQLEQAERSARELREQARRLEIDREATSREQTEVRQRREALEADLAQLQDRHALASRELGEAAQAADAARAQAEEAQAALDEARQLVRQAREREAAARADVAKVDESRASLQGKVNGLEALERDRVGLAPAAARLLKERSRFGEAAILGPLSDFITADATTAALVERYLGATVHAVVVRDTDVADAVRDWHSAANLGPLLLLPADAIPPAPEGGLAEQVGAAEAAGTWVRALLGGVRTLGDGTAFVDARGAMLLPGQTGGPGPLRRRAEITELRAELERTDARRNEAVQQLEAARTAVSEADRAQVVAAEATTVAQQEARRADDLRAELERRRARAERELADAQQLDARLVRRDEELAERLAALDERARIAVEQADTREREAADARAQLAESEHALETAREERTVWQVEQAQAQARMQVAQDRERRLAQELTTAAQRLEALHRELSTLSEADSQLADQMGAWRMDLESREAALGDIEQRLADAEQEVASADEALTAAEHALDDVRRANAALAEELHTAALRHTQLAGRREALRERLEAEWRRPLDELLSSFEPLEDEATGLREEAEELRRQLEQLGVVNPLAIEEHEEEVRRFDFLSAQRDDLSQAKAALQQAIREIDTTARELFLATFAQVRENFRQIFMTLFGGGECDIRLEDPQRPLDCDIEIHASPRGKRTQRIHLLSSGERALVALSLLFGIFLTKPSPFCLLDEVDAPLDDQNIGRFVRMLNQFKSKTQFIIITHNPRTTTEAADAVYGVTMQEPGVSSLVSVRLRGQQVDADGKGDGAPRADAEESSEAVAASA